MMIYMEHPKHGIEPIYVESEVAVRLAKGWTVWDIARASDSPSTGPVVAEVVEEVIPEVPEYVAPRRGRPPKER